MCIKIYIFNLKKQHKNNKTKTKETKEEKRISEEYLMGYDDIVCDLLYVLLTYLIKS